MRGEFGEGVRGEGSGVGGGGFEGCHLFGTYVIRGRGFENIYEFEKWVICGLHHLTIFRVRHRS